MTYDQLMWACALHLDQAYGDSAQTYAAEQASGLDLQSDPRAAYTWRAIQMRLSMLHYSCPIEGIS